MEVCNAEDEKEFSPEFRMDAQAKISTAEQQKTALNPLVLFLRRL
jgi:hypothetical protein